jgi:diaminopimelate decarboxylase
MDDLHSIAAQHGDDFHVLDIGKFQSNLLEMRQAFRNLYPNTEIAYSYKTNYTPQLGAAVQALGGYAEVVSAMEYHLARRIGIPGNRIVYNGPYKSAESFGQALIEGAIVNLDSERDLGLIVATSDQHAERAFEVVLRCNFALSTGAVSRFGFDVAGEAFRRAIQRIEALPNVTLVGLHCHFPDRDLNGYVERAQGLVDLARSVFGERLPKYLNIGGGYLGDCPTAWSSRRE